MIAAAAENNALGKDNDLLWRLPDDFKRFKKLTSHHPIIMGRKTFESLPEKFRSKMGERGIKLSGGQKQRIGIARALYKESEVIILDESTSALDSATEHEVMRTINQIDDKITIIIVAHRLETLRKLDRVIKLDNGKVAWEGKPSELIT